MARKNALIIDTGGQATEVRDRLAEIDQQIATKQQDLEAVVSELGDMWARAGMGDKAANKDAGKLAMRRSALQTEIDDLTITARSLRASLDAWDADEQARTAATVLGELETVTAAARDAEQRYSTQLRELATTGQELRELERRWQQACKVARPYGDVSASMPAPRNPVRAGPLANVIENPEAAITRWMKKPGHGANLTPPGRVQGPAKSAGASFTMPLKDVSGLIKGRGAA